MRIRTQLVVSIVIGAFLCVAMGVGVVLSIRSQEQFQEAQKRAQAAARESAGLLALTQEFAFYGEERAARQWRTRYALLTDVVTPAVTLREIDLPPLRELRENLSGLQELFVELEALSKGSEDGLKIRKKQMIVEHLVTNTQALAEAAYRWAEEVTELRRMTVRRFLNFFVLVTVVFALMITAIASLMIGRIIRPLTALQRAAAAVRQGDLSVRTNNQASDELGDLAREFDRMTAGLQKYAGTLTETNQALIVEVMLRTESEERFRLMVENVMDYAIISLNPDGFVVSWNAGAERITGYLPSEIIGRHFNEFYLASDVARNHPQRALDVVRDVGRFEEEGWRVRKDGSVFWASVVITALRDASGKLRGFGKITHDLTDRKKKQEAIEASLKEKETLLKEVYHRVKNNLQVVTSLLNMQVRSVPEGLGRIALKESADRIRAMALVHEKLYQSGNLASVPLGDYIDDLCRSMAIAAAADARGVTITNDIEPIDIGLDTAIPLGLILNELVSNSLKHAFPRGRPGTVKVGLHHGSNDTLVLSVSDNGVGMSHGTKATSNTSLGLKLVDTLVAQLDGELQFESGPGTSVTLQFALHRQASTAVA